MMKLKVSFKEIENTFKVKFGEVVNMGGSEGVIEQEKTVVPSNTLQVIEPDKGFTHLSKVTVEPIPEKYGLVTYDNNKILTVS